MRWVRRGRTDGRADGGRGIAVSVCAVLCCTVLFCSVLCTDCAVLYPVVPCVLCTAMCSCGGLVPVRRPICPRWRPSSSSVWALLVLAGSGLLSPLASLVSTLAWPQGDPVTVTGTGDHLASRSRLAPCAAPFDPRIRDSWLRPSHVLPCSAKRAKVLWRRRPWSVECEVRRLGSLVRCTALQSSPGGGTRGTSRNVPPESW